MPTVLNPSTLSSSETNSPSWRQGPAANFLLAILVLFGLFLRGETGLVPVVEAVSEGSLAEQSGLVVGQEIIAVDGESTKTVSAVRFELLKRLGDSGRIELTVGNALSDINQRYSPPITTWLGNEEAPDPVGALGPTLGVLPVKPEVGSLSEDGAATRAGFGWETSLSRPLVRGLINGRSGLILCERDQTSNSTSWLADRVVR